MSVALNGEVIWLEGVCRMEEAESLLQLLAEGPGRTVDLSAASELHTAVVQVLLAFRPACAGSPEEDFLRTHVAPALGLPPAAPRPAANL